MSDIALLRKAFARERSHQPASRDSRISVLRRVTSTTAQRSRLTTNATTELRSFVKLLRKVGLPLAPLQRTTLATAGNLPARWIAFLFGPSFSTTCWFAFTCLVGAPRACAANGSGVR